MLFTNGKREWEKTKVRIFVIMILLYYKKFICKGKTKMNEHRNVINLVWKTINSGVLL